MSDFIFDLPLWVTGPLIVLILCLYSWIGMVVVRRWVLPRLRIQDSDSDFNGAMLQAVMVFYGLAVALIAVSVWETYGEVSKTVSQEATNVAALYRDISAYPDPVRPELQATLRNYMDYVIDVAWPLQRKGEVPKGGVEIMNRFQATLYSFNPTNDSQKILHAEALHAYNAMLLSRRMRLDSVGTCLPGILWFIIGAGALISLCSSFFFKIHDARLQAIQSGLLAVFIGLVIFMILALDRPFRGDLGIPPDSYQLVRDQLMVP